MTIFQKRIAQAMTTITFAMASTFTMAFPLDFKLGEVVYSDGSITSNVPTSTPSTPKSTLDGISYVPSATIGAVDVINTAQHKVIKTIPFIGLMPTVIVATPDRSKIYVDNMSPLANRMTVIDTKTNAIVKRISFLGAPWAAMKMTSNGRYLYVPTTMSVIQVIDTWTDKIVKTFRVPVVPIDVRLSPDDSTLYVFNLNSVSAFNAVTGNRIKPTLYLTGFGPGWSEITKDGKKLFALNDATSNVSVIDLEAWKITKTIKLGFLTSPTTGAMNPDGSKLYVCNTFDYNMTVIDTKTDTITKVIRTPYAPISVGFNASGSEAYLSSLGSMSGVKTMFGTRNLLALALSVGVSRGVVTTYDTKTDAIKGQTVTSGSFPGVGVYF